MLKVWAIKNAYKGLRLSCLNKSLNFVSSPILVNANVNQRVCKLFKLPFISFETDGSIINENNREAPINPSTNLGKRSQITLKVGFASPPSIEVRLRYVQ